MTVEELINKLSVLDKDKLIYLRVIMDSDMVISADEVQEVFFRDSQHYEIVNGTHIYYDKHRKDDD